MKVPVLQIIKYQPKAIISRPFPYKGEILVKIGDTVTPITQLASAKVSFLTQTFKFSGRLKVKENDWVKGGQILSLGGFFGGDDVVAPFAGIITNIDEKIRQFTLSSPPRDFFLVAGCDGTISQIVNDSEIKIKAKATSIRGVIGVHTASGELILENRMKEEESVGKVILVKFLNKVLLTKAKTLGVAGIITGALDWETFLEMRATKHLGLLVLNGFGATAVPNQNDAIFRLLEEQVGKFVVVSGSHLEVLVIGATSNRIELNPPLMAELTEGACVKIFGWPYFNAVGTVLEILPSDFTFDSELIAPAVRVKLASNGKEIVVPIETLGVLV